MSNGLLLIKGAMLDGGVATMLEQSAVQVLLPNAATHAFTVATVKCKGPNWLTRPGRSVCPGGQIMFQRGVRRSETLTIPAVLHTSLTECLLAADVIVTLEILYS